MLLIYLFATAFASVQLDIGRMIVSDAGAQTANHKVSRGTDPRDSVVIGNDYYYYYATIGLGTPAQLMNVQIDTGSSDLWVMASSNPYCRLSPNDDNYVNCSDSLVFDPSKSSSYQNSNQRFTIDYADGTFARGHMAHDTMSLGKFQLSSCPFALANRASSGQIVMGIGFQADESLGQKYNNVPLMLRAKGMIHTNSYSLWLNDIHATSGAILFGAVDHSKYTNSLGVVPIVASQRGSRPDQMTIMMHGINIGSSSTPTIPLVDCSLPVLLDSGTSYVYMPSSIAQAMANAVGMRYDSNSGMYTGTYPKGKGGFFEFNFSGVLIRAPFDLLIDPSDNDPTGKQYELLVVSSDGSDSILGDAFLRAAYVVYDLDNYEVGLGQARFNVQTQIIEDITNKIPGKRATRYSETISSYVRTARLNRPINLVNGGREALPTSSSSIRGTSTRRTVTRRTTITVGQDRTVRPYDGPKPSKNAASTSRYCSTVTITAAPAQTQACTGLATPSAKYEACVGHMTRIDNNLKHIISSLSGHRSTLMRYFETQNGACTKPPVYRIM